MKLYKNKIGLESENGKENTEKYWESAEFRHGSFCVGTLGWPNGCSGVGFGFGFEGASSGSVGLVAFWLFCVVNFGWSGMRSRLLGVDFQLGKTRRFRPMRRDACVAVVGCFSCSLELCCSSVLFLS